MKTREEDARLNQTYDGGGTCGFGLRLYMVYDIWPLLVSGLDHVGTGTGIEL
jgi:hypothetical protein